MARENKAAPYTIEEGGLDTIIGHFLEVQANLREVIAFLDKVVATESERDKASQKAQITKIVTEEKHFVQKQLEQIQDCMEEVHKLRSTRDVAMYRDDVERVRNAWERLEGVDLVPDPDKIDLLTVRNHLTQCKELRREIGFFTIPKRIRGFAQEIGGVGAALDFHERFKDELEDAADRGVMLRRIAGLDVDRVGGMVDVERGMIYRVGSPARRLGSYILILGAAVLGLAVTYFLSVPGVLNLPGFTGDGAYAFNQLWPAYLLTVVGVLAHIIKKAGEMSFEERSKGAEGGAQVILDRLWLWIHVREYRFLMTVVTAVGVFIILVTTRQLDNIKALMAGYTVDSFSDLVFQRFNTAVSTYAQEVKKALAVQPTD